jgi:hypothetical protein
MTDRDDNIMALQEAYANIYNELVKPDKVFVASQYFRQRWVPLLGPTLAWVIIALRQHCYWNKNTGEKRDWCRVSQEGLAREVGIGITTLKRLLKHEHAGKFILAAASRYRYDPKLRKQVREPCTYRIRMDDPLIPEDEARLKELLAQKLSGLNVDTETGQMDILQVLDRLSGAGASDLQSNLGFRSDGQAQGTGEGEIGDMVSDLAKQVSELLTGQDGRPSGGDSAEEKMPYPGAVFVSPDELRSFNLAEEQVLIPWGDEGYLAVAMAEVVKRDIRSRGRHFFGGRQTECFYSVQHALGEGGEDWLPEEQERIDCMSRLECDLSKLYERLGGFSLEEALRQYFSPQFTANILEEKTEMELERIAGWVAYTRKAKGLNTPAGFLRTRIESDEQPPPA